MPVEVDDVAFRWARFVAETQERLQHVGTRCAQIPRLGLDLQDRPAIVNVAENFAPQRVVLVADRSEPLRRRRRQRSQRSAKHAFRPLEVHLRRDADVSEVSCVAERPQLFFRRRVERARTAAIVGHGVGKHRPGFAARGRLVRTLHGRECIRRMAVEGIIGRDPSAGRATRPLRDPRAARCSAAWVRFIGRATRGSTATSRSRSCRRRSPATRSGAAGSSRKRGPLRRSTIPNILAVYDVGVRRTASPYIVSELLEGETLRERARCADRSRRARRSNYARPDRTRAGRRARRRTSSTATSSPRTSSSRRTGASRSSTSAWRS